MTGHMMIQISSLHTPVYLLQIGNILLIKIPIFNIWLIFILKAYLLVNDKLNIKLIIQMLIVLIQNVLNLLFLLIHLKMTMTTANM